METKLLRLDFVSLMSSISDNYRFVKWSEIATSPAYGGVLAMTNVR